MDLGLTFEPPKDKRCALCGRELIPRSGIISAQYWTCNMDSNPDTPKHTGPELRAYFTDHGVSFTR